MFPSPCGDYGSYLTTNYLQLKNIYAQFPSPCGDYGSYRITTITNTLKVKSSFRPLAGIMVLIDLEALEMCYDDVQFPSPCGDYGSYQTRD